MTISVIYAELTKHNKKILIIIKRASSKDTIKIT